MKVLALILVLLPSICFGRSIHVEWGYTPPSEPAVTGFNLYQEGIQSCKWPGKDITFGDCDVALTTKTTNFTLTAAFADGTESPHSSPFAFSDPDFGNIPSPSIINITFK